MADNFNNDPFGGTDPFGGQQTMTPGFNSFKTTGTNKLLVVLFVTSSRREVNRVKELSSALLEFSYNVLFIVLGY